MAEQAGQFVSGTVVPVCLGVVLAVSMVAVCFGWMGKWFRGVVD